MKLRMCPFQNVIDNAIPVHFFNGVWGLVSVGLFAAPNRLLKVYNNADHPGFFYTLSGKPDIILLCTQIIGILFIVGWVMVIMLPFFIWLDWKGVSNSQLTQPVKRQFTFHVRAYSRFL